MFRRDRALRALAMAGLVALAACGGTSTGQGGNGTPLPGASATTTGKAKPDGIPPITVAYCTGLLTLAEANQIMQSAPPATTIRVDSAGPGGSCNYEYAQFKPVVSVLFELFPEGDSLDYLATQELALLQKAPGAKSTKTAVTGVGNQALYLSASAQLGAGIWEDLLVTTYGSIYISCNLAGAGAPPVASLQVPLTQVCQKVLGRL